MNPLLIHNARFIDIAQQIDRAGSMVIKDGRIAWWGKTGEAVPAGNYDLIEGKGLVVCPGFIDLHCHLREPGFEAKETIATGTTAALRGGFTTVCCMPNTRPPQDSVETIDFVKNKGQKEGAVRVLPVACVSKGRQGTELTDMALLAKTGIAGFSDDGDPVRNDAVMRAALEMSKKLGLPIMDHCEDEVGGSAGGEVKMVARDLQLAEATGGWVHIQHVSVAAAADMIKAAKAKGVRVTAEATPHHLTLNDKAIRQFGTLAKVNPPLRSERDRQAIVTALLEGTIDCIATDHAPHTAADKQQDYTTAASGISGFETAFGALMRLVHEGELSLPELIYRLTTAPGGIIGRQAALTVGKLIDITIVDPEKEWVVDVSKFASKGRNIPWNGVKLQGKVMATLPQGKLAYKDSTLPFKENFDPQSGKQRK